MMRIGPSLFVEAVQVLELGPQYGRLQIIQSTVHADDVIAAAIPAAVIAQNANILCQTIIIGHDHTAVTATAKVLTGVKGITAEVTPGAGHYALASGPARLGAVFNKQQPMLLAEFFQGFQIGRLTEQMDRQDRPGLRGDGALDFLHVEVKGPGINVDKNRGATDVSNRFSRCDEGKWRRNDFITLADAGCPQCQMQDIGDGSVDFLFQFPILETEINHWYCHLLPRVKPLT